MALVLAQFRCTILAPGELDLTHAGARGVQHEDAGTKEDAGGAAETQSPDSGRFVFVVVEGEHCDAVDNQRLSHEWARLPDTSSAPAPDPDPVHPDASGEGYMEILPDERVVDSDPFEGLWKVPGEGPLLHYYVNFPRAGDYQVWVRGYSTGTEDETVHLAIDKDWDNAQTAKLCSGSDGWQWASQQRTDAYSCGTIGTLIIHVPTPGKHTLTFAGREDGFELDKWLMTTDQNYIPRGLGPAESR